MGYDRYDRDTMRGQSSGGYGRDRDFGQNRGAGSDQGYGRDRDYGRQPQGYDYDNRGFLDRAGDEVRSWFGDEDAERRRRMDDRYEDRSGPRGGSNYGSDNSRGGYGRDDDRNLRQDRQANYGSSNYGSSGYGARDQRDQGEDRSRGFGGGYGYDRSHDRDDDRSYGPGSVSNYGQRDAGRESRQEHEPSYRSWRDRQMESFDRDYEDYRRENQSRFDSEFAQWRTRREGQRRHLGSVREHQEVVGSDGQHLGTVDHVQGDQIKLTKNDQNAGGHHHFIPCSWIESVDDKVKISKTASEARQHWTDEARNAGSSFFGRNDESGRAQGSSGQQQSGQSGQPNATSSNATSSNAASTAGSGSTQTTNRS